MLFLHQGMKCRYWVNQRISKCVVATLLHHSIEELEAGQENPNSATDSLGNGDKLEALTMFSYFTVKILDEVIINSLAHFLRRGIPSASSTLLPGISVSKKWKNGRTAYKYVRTVLSLNCAVASFTKTVR